MSMPSPPLRISVFVHSCLPSEARSANAARFVAPKAPWAVIGTVHATPSFLALDALIGPPTFREFCRSALGRAHVVRAAPVLPLSSSPPPQAATSRLAPTSKHKPANHRK